MQDPGNVGAVVRAAEACGATGLVTGGGTADPFGWKALRGAMGSTFRLPIAVRQPLPGRRRGGAGGAHPHLRHGAARRQIPLASPICACRRQLLLGGEGPGSRLPWSIAADQRLSIPMREPVDSLNVATAAAVILYEAARQRSHVAL